jgi:hypothetical protein
MGEEERKKRGGRMGEERVDCYIKHKGANLVGALCALQCMMEAEALLVGPRLQ